MVNTRLPRRQARPSLPRAGKRATPRSASSTSFRFLELPGEIRNAIYDLVLCTKNTRIPANRQLAVDERPCSPYQKIFQLSVALPVSDGSPDPKRSFGLYKDNISLALLRVNKQIHLEALSVLYFKNDWILFTNHCAYFKVYSEYRNPRRPVLFDQTRHREIYATHNGMPFPPADTLSYFKKSLPWAMFVELIPAPSEYTTAYVRDGALLQIPEKFVLHAEELEEFCQKLMTLPDIFEASIRQTRYVPATSRMVIHIDVGKGRNEIVLLKTMGQLLRRFNAAKVRGSGPREYRSQIACNLMSYAQDHTSVVASLKSRVATTIDVSNSLKDPRHILLGSLRTVETLLECLPTVMERYHARSLLFPLFLQWSKSSLLLHVDMKDKVRFPDRKYCREAAAFAYAALSLTDIEFNEMYRTSAILSSQNAFPHPMLMLLIDKIQTDHDQSPVRRIRAEALSRAHWYASLAHGALLDEPRSHEERRIARELCRRSQNEQKLFKELLEFEEVVLGPDFIRSTRRPK